VEDVAGELGVALAAVEGLTVAEWGVQRIHPPTALVAMPERVDYDATYGRGSDRFPDWSVFVLVARPTDPVARRAIGEYADGSGAKSVKAAVEAHTYTACDSVRVAWCEFDAVTYAGNDYLAAMFHLDITGQGS